MAWRRRIEQARSGQGVVQYEDAIRLDMKNGMAYCGRGRPRPRRGISRTRSPPSMKRSARPEGCQLVVLQVAQGRGRVASPICRKSKFAAEAKRGSDAFERRDYDQAIVAWDKAIRIDPKHSEAHRWRGDASLNKHELTGHCPSTTKHYGSIRKMAWLTVAGARLD